MDDRLLEGLLNEEESSSLDFKRDQYLFKRASQAEKSELLKDILAFANALRRTDAYVLIGVDEVKGGRAKIAGITDHLEDSHLQQFVNNKTNRPIAFGYRVYPFEGKHVGIIQVPLQRGRPFYLKNDYGKLTAQVVYIRRGSSTAQATPDELHAMGIADSPASARPLVNLQLADLASRRLLGHKLALCSTVLEAPPSDEIPDYGVSRGHFAGIAVSFVNRDYYRDCARYLKQQSFLIPVAVAVTNVGDTPAVNVEVRAEIPHQPGLSLLGEDELVSEPSANRLGSPLIGLVDQLREGSSALQVTSLADTWHVNVALGTIRPKATEWPIRPLYIGSETSVRLEFTAVVFAENLSEPATIPLRFDIETVKAPLSLKELIRKADLVEDEF